MMRWTLGAVALVAAVGCSGSEPSPGPPASVTYQQHIRPILEARCYRCHGEGGIAPLRLSDEEKVVMFREFIVAAVIAREMPPPPTTERCDDPLKPCPLTDEQIALFRKWQDEGFARGRESDYAPFESPAMTDAGDLVDGG